MLKLQLKPENEKYAVFLDHRKLINKVYSENVGNNETYELKSQLFHFQPKTTPELQPNQCKRKRKLNETTNYVQEDNIKGYLDLLPKPKEGSDKTTLPRYWEDEYTIPKLHGSNTSGKFQNFQTGNNESNAGNFLIPQETSFYNYNVDQLTALLPQLLPSYDLIVLDPPWRNKYIRRLKRAKQSLGYAMLDNEQLALLPLRQLTHVNSLVAIWCTNSTQHQQALETLLLPRWHLRLLHKLRWYKLNTEHQLIREVQQGEVIKKQPYEMLYLACHADSDLEYASELKHAEIVLSVPSIVHSHKPPLLEWLLPYLQLAPGQSKPNCLELFARYLQPQFTSIGLEVFKLMDERLYNKILLEES